MHPALHDPEKRLAFRGIRLVPFGAAIEPAVSPLHRARRVLAIGVVGRALVEGEGDVRAQRGLHRHRLLGTHEALRPVDVRAEADAALRDLEDAALRTARPATALDLVGDAAVSEREDLKASGVGDDRALP